MGYLRAKKSKKSFEEEENELVVEVEKKEEIDLGHVRARIKEIAKTITDTSYIMTNDSLYLLIIPENVHSVVKNNYYALSTLAQIPHAKLFFDFGNNRIRVSLTQLNDY